MQEYAVIAVLGAIAATDTTVFGQFMVSQPLISAALAGYFLGDLQSAIYIGSIMQLMWLKLIPAGGAIRLNGNLGTVAAVSVLELSAHEFPYTTEALRFTVILYGIAASYIFGYFTTKQRQINLSLIRTAHSAVENNRLLRFQSMHFLGVVITGIAGILITVVFAFAGKWLLFRIPAAYFSVFEAFFPFGLYAFWGIGIGTVVSMVWTKKAWYYGVAGLIAGFGIVFLL